MVPLNDLQGRGPIPLFRHRCPGLEEHLPVMFDAMLSWLGYIIQTLSQASQCCCSVFQMGLIFMSVDSEESKRPSTIGRASPDQLRAIREEECGTQMSLPHTVLKPKPPIRSLEIPAFIHLVDFILYSPYNCLNEFPKINPPTSAQALFSTLQGPDGSRCLPSAVGTLCISLSVGLSSHKNSGTVFSKTLCL